MRQAIIALGPRRHTGQHAGLLLDRFLAEAAVGNPAAKRVLLDAAIAASNASRPIYQRAYERWSGLIAQAPHTRHAILRTTGRLIVGLGMESVLETGVRLHRTYGAPLIPGSALKGLACHYCDRVWGKDQAPFRRKGDYHRLLFGTTEDGGAIRFEDAWIAPECLDPPRQGLVLDVLTPHHPQWQTDPSAAPTDFDNPNPVTYLSVVGRFLVAVAWQGPEHEEAERWTALALELLTEALKEWGVGGKTSSGYGRLAGGQQQPAPAVAPAPPPAAAPAQPTKRNSGTAVKVKILGPRQTGFDVQEEGRNPGTLTLGAPPPGTDVQVGAVVDVLIHDDAKKPQYKWPEAKKPAKPGANPRR